MPTAEMIQTHFNLPPTLAPAKKLPLAYGSDLTNYLQIAILITRTHFDSSHHVNISPISTGQSG